MQTWKTEESELRRDAKAVRPNTRAHHVYAAANVYGDPICISRNESQDWCNRVVIDFYNRVGVHDKTRSARGHCTH